MANKLYVVELGTICRNKHGGDVPCNKVVGDDGKSTIVTLWKPAPEYGIDLSKEQLEKVLPTARKLSHKRARVACYVSQDGPES